MSLWLIVNMMKYREANSLVLRRFFKDHRDSTFSQLKWAINRLGVASLWKTTVSPMEITFIPTGQKILFRGLDDPMSVTSITVEKGYLTWVWFEEFFQITKEDDFNKIDLSIRGNIPPPLFKQITGTLNPWNERHWIKKRFFDSPDENVFTSRTNYLVNEFLGADDVALFKRIKEKNPRRYKVEGLGYWGIAEGLIYNNWEELEFDKSKLLLEIPDLGPLNGLDFGYSAAPTAFVAGLISLRRKEIYIYDEHYQKGMLNNQIADMLKYKGFAKEEIIADSAEQKSIAEIKRYGIPRIKPARKGRDSVLHGIQFLQQFRIYVHPRCANTMLELNNYAWKEKSGEKLNEPIDDFNHLLDAARYGAEKYMKPKREIRARIIN